MLVRRSLLTAPHTYNVIIIGAGISGLTAAYYLQNRDILVLEKRVEQEEEQLQKTYTAGKLILEHNIYHLKALISMSLLNHLILITMNIQL